MKTDRLFVAIGAVVVLFGGVIAFTRWSVTTYLPRLADAGYIEWDRDSGEISKGPRFEEIEPLLNLVESHADELPADWP